MDLETAAETQPDVRPIVPVVYATAVKVQQALELARRGRADFRKQFGQGVEVEVDAGSSTERAGEEGDSCT